MTNLDRLARFRDLYASEIGAPFVFMERPENMINEKVRIIKQAGAQMVSIGIESGDENIRRNTLNRQYSQEVIKSAFRTARKYDLATHAFTMIGFADEDKNSFMKTFRLLREVQPNTVQTSIIYPLPGTKLYEKVVGEGLFDTGTSMPKSLYNGSCLNFPESKKKELIRWQYVLSNYKSKLIWVFIMVLPNQLIFAKLVFFRKLYIRLKENLVKEGFFSTLRTISHKIRT